MPGKRIVRWWQSINPYLLAGLGAFVGIGLLLGAANWEKAVEDAKAVNQGHESSLQFVTRRLITDIGVSLLVFGVLSASFEGRARKQVEDTIDELGTNVFSDKIYPAFKRLRDDAVMDFSRRDLLYTVRILERHPLDPEKLMRIEFDYGYTVKNETKKQQIYTISIENNEWPNSGLEGTIADVKFIYQRQSHNPAKEPEQAEKGLARWARTISLEAGQEERIQTSWSYAARPQDHFDFFMSYLSEGIEIEVEYLAEFEVVAEMFSSVANLEHQPDADSDTRKVWRISKNEKMLPGQAFTVGWRPKPPAPSRSGNVSGDDEALQSAD